ncbi:MFS general substrate transporter [Rhizodiscina lignyota]|uniref:MFS general substrate transporter n=1 Tax=Rhizodiscina lignyota TaxID=1504668 RepID=A0A9P4INT4_9PEZI|nr:MFS general substrate transporter [Rhizodiscina lignyota]
MTKYSDNEKGGWEANDSDSKLHAHDGDLKLDPYGIPLKPQPSRFKDDPLNWPRWLKWSVLIQVGFMAFLGPFNAAVPNPSLVLLGKAFHRPVEIVTYSTTTSIILGGVSPFIWTPLTNVYGRRPITLLSQIFAIVGQIGSANSKTFSQLLGTRAINGIGMGGMMSVGTTCLNDMFFMHERGEKSGVYTIFVTNGAHIAVIIGGFLGQNLGWQWDFWMPAIITALSFSIALFAFPETLFSRGPEFLSQRTHERTYWEMLFNLRGNLIPQRKLKPRDFFTSFYMLKYPSIAFPFWFYTWCWTFINILPAISMANIYTKFYGFKSGAIGLCTGIPLIIGTLIGECTAGKLSDVLMTRLAKKHDGVRKPEHRLYLTTAAICFMVAGMIIFGVCIEHRTAFVPPLVGLAVGVLGLQIASTCLYAYVSDCYRPQTPESAVLMNLSRGLSFVMGFFNVVTWEAIGFDWAWTTFALILLVFWFPILSLMIWGEKWRRRLGEPSFHQYI